MLLNLTQGGSDGTMIYQTVCTQGVAKNKLLPFSFPKGQQKKLLPEVAASGVTGALLSMVLLSDLSG